MVDTDCYFGFFPFPKLVEMEKYAPHLQGVFKWFCGKNRVRRTEFEDVYKLLLSADPKLLSSVAMRALKQKDFDTEHHKILPWPLLTLCFAAGIKGFVSDIFSHPILKKGFLSG